MRTRNCFLIVTLPQLRALEASSRSERCAEGALRTAAEALAWTAQMTTLLETLSVRSIPWRQKHDG